MDDDSSSTTRISARRVAVGLVLMALVIAGCGSSHAANTSTTKLSSVTTSTLQSPTTASSTTPTTSSSGTTTSSSAPTTSTTSTGSSPQNLLATAATKEALVAAFVAFTHDPAPEIAGTEPGSVYYAYVPSAGTYWAFARFLPSSSASQQTLVSLQDGGNIGIFRKQAEVDWMMLSVGGEPFCPTKSAIPASVQALWGFTDPPDCG